MIELTAAGRNLLTREAVEDDGRAETRGFLHDSDAVILKDWCESRGQVLPAIGC